MLRLAIGAPPQETAAADIGTAGRAELPQPRPRSSANGGTLASTQVGRPGVGAQLPATPASIEVPRRVFWFWVTQILAMTACSVPPVMITVGLLSCLL